MTSLRQTTFHPMGLTLRLITNSPAILEAARQSFGGFGPPPTANEPPDLTFRFFAHAAPESEPLQPRYHSHGALVYQTTAASSLIAHCQRGEAHGYFSAAVLDNPAFFRWHFLELAFFVMLANRGLMGVHGAAIAKNGRAILLRAASGGGKTTLAYAAARRRFQALAEDVVWLDVARGGWWGMPWAFHLLPDAKNLFPELVNYPPVLQTNGETKLEVNLEQVRPDSTIVWAEAGPVVIVERAPGQPSRLTALPLAEAKSLWAAGEVGAETDFPGYDQHVETLLRDNAYRLISGDDLEASLDLLEELLG